MVLASRPTHHTIVGVDVASSGHLNDQHQLRMRADLRGVLATALAWQGLQWIHLHRDDLGDGIRLVIPASISPSELLDPFVPTLTYLLREHRRAADEQVRLRLRVAVHMGLVHHDGHGFAGRTLVHAARLLDAEPVRKALAAAPLADLVLVVSETIYDAIVAQGYGLDPDTYTQVLICEKETTAPAWIHLPARPAAPGLETPLMAV